MKRTYQTNTKADIVAYIADSTGLENAQAQRALESALEAVAICLQAGFRVEIRGFGSFTPRLTRRQSYDFAKKMPSELRSAVEVRFKPGKQLKESLKKPYKT